MIKADIFYREKITKIFSEQKHIMDIGGGLRIRKDKGDRYNSGTQWIADLAQQVDYRIMDPVDTFHPDVIGDIHDMPFTDGALDAIICCSVLEHVKNPFIAANEMYRTLKTGGYAYVYVPFLYYYHAEPGYYGDYWRFTEEAIRELFKEFATIEICPVRGALATWVILNPWTRFLEPAAAWADRVLGKNKTKQVSAYAIFLVK